MTNPVINKWGDKNWYDKGKLHREDGPAVIQKNGDKYWYKNDKYHREDGPAIEKHDGEYEWYLNGKWHREDGPAIKHRLDDYKAWYIHGKCIKFEMRGKMYYSPCKDCIVECVCDDNTECKYTTSL